MTYATRRAIAVFVFSVCVLSLSPLFASAEVQFSAEQLKMLDQMEEHDLLQADKVFNKGDFKNGVEQYDGFVTTYPNSKGAPYALLRKGRCQEQVNKRNAAIKSYTQIQDYYPTASEYVAAAIFYTGQVYLDDGETEKAMAQWKKMADNATYSKHFLAAGALNKLAENVLKQNQADVAAGYFRKAAVNFRHSNGDESRAAILKARELYTRKPDEESLRSFYKEVHGFEHDPRQVDGEVALDRLYWQRVIEDIKTYGVFTKEQADAHDRYYKYWAGVMEAQKPFADWDDFQIVRIGFELAYEQDVNKWIERLDAQFAQGKQDDYARIVKWVGVYAANDKKMDEYYAKLDFGKMKNAEIQTLMQALFAVKGREGRAKAVFGKLRLAEISDGEKRNIAWYLREHDGDLLRATCLSFQDHAAGLDVLLAYYRDMRDAKQGVEIADELAKDTQHAKSALYRKGELLQWSGDNVKAIEAYRQSDAIPENLFRIAECLVALKKNEQAVAQLKEIEFLKGQFPNAASQAVWRIALIYKAAEDKPKLVATLGRLMLEYKASPEATDTHIWQKELQLTPEQLKGGKAGGLDADEK